MDKAKKHALALEIVIYLKKHPDAKPKDVKKFVLSGVNNLNLLWSATVYQFVKDKINKFKDIETLKQIKRILNRKWRHISNDRNLCRSKIASIPNRITAMIEKGDAQVHKAD